MILFDLFLISQEMTMLLGSPHLEPNNIVKLDELVPGEFTRAKLFAKNITKKFCILKFSIIFVLSLTIKQSI